MSASTGETVPAQADYEPSAHELRAALIRLAREQQIDQPVQIACDAQTLLGTHLDLDETRKMLGWANERFRQALSLADMYVWSTYDTQEFSELTTTGNVTSVVDTDAADEQLADVEKIPRQLPIERIFEGVIAPEDVESIMNLPDLQYQEVIRFFKQLLDMTQDERITPSIELMAPLMLWMRGLRMNEVAGTLGVSRHALRGNMNTFLELAGRYQADIFELLVSLEQDVRQPQVTVAPLLNAEAVVEYPDSTNGDASMLPAKPFDEINQTPEQTSDPVPLQPVDYVVVPSATEANDQRVVSDAEIVDESLTTAEPEEVAVETSEDQTEEPLGDIIVDSAVEAKRPQMLTSTEVTALYLDELGIDLTAALDARARDFTTEALKAIKILRTSITTMREWHKTTLCLTDEEHRRLNMLLGIDVHRNNKGEYSVTDSKLGPKPLSFIRKAAGNGRRSKPEEAQAAIHSALAKLHDHLSKQEDERAS